MTRALNEIVVGSVVIELEQGCAFATAENLSGPSQFGSTISTFPVLDIKLDSLAENDSPTSASLHQSLGWSKLAEAGVSFKV